MTEKTISTDKRVPVEVWEKIFIGLYPSQLSRLSMVSKTFYSITTSLPIWTRLFALTHPNRELRVLRGRTASTCCMLYMCAISLHFCEDCRRLIPFQQDNPYKLPLPVLVTLPSTSAVTTTITNNISGNQIPVGNMVNFKWRIRKCFLCRDSTSTAVAPELLPAWESPDMSKRRDIYGLDGWENFYPRLHVARRLVIHRRLLLSDVIKHLTDCLGGPVGVEAAKKSTKDYDIKTWSRILWYQDQD